MMTTIKKPRSKMKPNTRGNDAPSNSIDLGEEVMSEINAGKSTSEAEQSGANCEKMIEDDAWHSYIKRKEEQRAKRADGTRYNAIKGGLHTSTLLPDEDPNEIENHFEKLCTELNAQGIIERSFLRDYVGFDLRASRIARYEATIVRSRLYSIKAREEFCSAAGLLPQESLEIPHYYIEMDKLSMMMLLKVDEAIENLLELIEERKLEEERLANRGPFNDNGGGEIGPNLQEQKELDVGALCCKSAGLLFPEVWEELFEDQNSTETGSFIKALRGKYYSKSEIQLLTKFKEDIFKTYYYETKWLVHRERYQLIAKGIRASCALAAISDTNVRRAEAQLNRKKLESLNAFDAAQRRRLNS
jgi:hypothetical protein